MKETTIKKVWLMLLMFNSLGVFIAILSLLIYGTLFQKGDAAGIFFVIIFLSSVCFIINWMYYNCAYKKPGTKLLIISIVFSAIYLFKELSTLSKAFPSLFTLQSEIKISQHLMNILIPMLEAVLSVLWIYFSYQLLSINKSIKLEKLKNDPAIKEIIECLKLSKDLDDLYEKFGACVRKYPQYHSLAKKHYKERKSCLMN